MSSSNISPTISTASGAQEASISTTSSALTDEWKSVTTASRTSAVSFGDTTVYVRRISRSSSAISVRMTRIASAGKIHQCFFRIFPPNATDAGNLLPASCINQILSKKGVPSSFRRMPSSKCSGSGLAIMYLRISSMRTLSWNVTSEKLTPCLCARPVRPIRCR